MSWNPLNSRFSVWASFVVAADGTFVVVYVTIGGDYKDARSGNEMIELQINANIGSCRKADEPAYVLYKMAHLYNTLSYLIRQQN